MLRPPSAPRPQHNRSTLCDLSAGRAPLVPLHVRFRPRAPQPPLARAATLRRLRNLILRPSVLDLVPPAGMARAVGRALGARPRTPRASKLSLVVLAASPPRFAGPRRRSAPRRAPPPALPSRPLYPREGSPGASPARPHTDAGGATVARRGPRGAARPRLGGEIGAGPPPRRNTPAPLLFQAALYKRRGKIGAKKAKECDALPSGIW